jgi:O-glycosyl hydrolase
VERVNVRKKIFCLAVMLVAFAPPLAYSATATIDASTTYQYMRGFGGSSAWHNNAYAAAAATLFWDGTTMNGNNRSGSGCPFSVAISPTTGRMVRSPS